MHAPSQRKANSSQSDIAAKTTIIPNKSGDAILQNHQASKPQSPKLQNNHNEKPNVDHNTTAKILHSFSTIPVYANRPFSIQPKLTINTPGDQYEQEADVMADKVMRMPINGQPVFNPSPLSISQLQRKCAHCEEEEKLQRKEIASQPKEASGEVSSYIGSLSSKGSPLPENTKRFFEPRFGHDFSNVKIHHDGEAARSSQAVNALAYTVGNNIVFNHGRFSPESEGGKSLLAHELTHVVQQGFVTKIQKKEALLQQQLDGQYSSDEEDSLRQNHISKGQLKIQRSTAWSGATVHETVNLAQMLLGGDAPITWHQLNGTSLVSESDANNAIQKPSISTAVTGTNWVAKVDSVPAQTGSGDETVLSPGPWSVVTTKANAGAALGLAACSGTGNTTLKANGKPSDELVYKANRKHENHHLADHKVAFTDTIGAWDKKLQDAKNAGTQFNGTNAADATATLWNAMGGTPEEVARNYRAQGFAKGGVFHTTPNGGPMETSNPKSNADCSTSSKDVTNPA